MVWGFFPVDPLSGPFLLRDFLIISAAEKLFFSSLLYSVMKQVFEVSSVFLWLVYLYNQMHVAGEEKFYIFAPGKYKVGRKGTSIMLLLAFYPLLFLLNATSVFVSPYNYYLRNIFIYMIRQ